ncbi:PA14 domain-containing protein [Viscerimonas tarda]
MSVSLVGQNKNAEGRTAINLSGAGWRLCLDKEASWKNDKLYLPDEAKDLSKLPVNAPTGGWNVLNESAGLSVSVPGTVEEYLTTSDYPRPENFVGVSWWFRTLEIPAELKDKRFIISFESVRMRAEVYLDGQLVAYDLIGESPFQADITGAVRAGRQQTLAVRVTNPGGNFHWQDFDRLKWNENLIPPGRGFGGIIGRVKLEAVSPLYISDIYMQNTPAITKVNAIVSVNNLSSSPLKRDVELLVKEKANPSKIVFRQQLNKEAFAKGERTLTIPVNVPDARLWDLDKPNLYVCEILLKDGKQVADSDKETFGFRWFAPEGIGQDAVLRLNGRRIMLRTAISWGYWPVTGLIATPEMAERQVTTARNLGLNMLNFHRSIGSPVVLEKADEAGFLYFEEPGSFHSANHDPFIQAIVNEKLQRMVRRDRSHPSLIIYNLINEFGGVLSRDKELVEKRMKDMQIAHAIDPSRVMTFTSGWAGKEDSEEDSKAHLRPFDETLYRRGWFDNHRAGGPETWLEEYYKSPEENLMYTNNRTEIYMRGEEGAISTPPRIEKINEEIATTHITGWDGKFWQTQYKAFEKLFGKKNLKPYFGTIDALTRSMGNVQLEHQGRRIQGMRMQNTGDVYAINGWEAMPYDNHSGIVDIYRNPKGDASALSYYTQPLYVAVSPRSQIVKLPGSVPVDFYIVNEKDLKGNYILQIAVVTPDGRQVYKEEKKVDVEGGETFGQLLWENAILPLNGTEGMYSIEARLLDASRKVLAEGNDKALGVDWSGKNITGNGAYYGKADDKVAAFYKKETGKDLAAYKTGLGKLDWIIVSRPSLDAPQLIDAAFLKDLQLKFYKDDDMGDLASTQTDTRIERNFAEGAQPDPSVPANQSFSAVWEGNILPAESGQYLIGLSSNRGIRLYIDGQRVIDEWHNTKEVSLQRPASLEAGKPVAIRVEYRQMQTSGNIQLEWSRPGTSAIAPQALIDRVKNDGTTLILLESADSWMEIVAGNTGVEYKGSYVVGKNWVGGIHFVKDHPLFKGLPVNTALNWPYQALVRDGDRRTGFRIEGEEMVVGSYRSTPFELGTAVGVIPCGKGKVIFSTLDIANNLDNSSNPAEVARKLLCNYISYATQK